MAYREEGRCIVPIDAALFRQSLSRFASGVTVVTMATDQERNGMTVSAFCSVSLNPPYILICLDHTSHNIQLIRTSGVFGVNILAEDQAYLSAHFASKHTDKLNNVSHYIGQLGVPLLNDALVRMECKVVHEYAGGDHVIFLGQIESSTVEEEKRPLLYYSGQYGTFTPKV